MALRRQMREVRREYHRDEVLAEADEGADGGRRAVVAEGSQVLEGPQALPEVTHSIGNEWGREARESEDVIDQCDL